MKLLKRVTLVVLVIGVALSGFGYLEFRRALTDEFVRLEADSQIQTTQAGAIEYIVKGTEGPTVLFLHGMPGGYDQAPENWPGYTLLAPSRPGYLRTDIQVGSTPSQQAAAYAALLDELGLEKVIVLGVSGGGPSALEFAANYPERTEALIMLEAISQRFPNEGEMSSLMTSDFLYWSLFSVLLGTQGIEGLAEMQIVDPGQRELVLVDPDKSKRFEDTLWSVWPGSRRVEGWRNDMVQVNLLNVPPNVTVPTLIIHGENDSTVPVGHSEMLATQIADSELHVLAGATHLMPLTHDTEVQELTMNFLAKHNL